ALPRIEAARSPGITVRVELDLRQRNLSLEYEPLRTSLYVELVVCARPELLSDLAAPVATRIERKDYLVGLVRQDVRDRGIQLVERFDLFPFDIDLGNPGIVNTLVESLYPVPH